VTDATTPSIGEIADLLAWARSVSERGPHADPAERAAFLAAKTDLLARITGRPRRTGTEGGGH
jgi:hypothetical protein